MYLAPLSYFKFPIVSVLMKMMTFWQILKFRYERLRGVAGRIQNALGDLASMGEKVHSLLSWRDPR